MKLSLIMMKMVQIKIKLNQTNQTKIKKIQIKMKLNQAIMIKVQIIMKLSQKSIKSNQIKRRIKI